MFFLNCTENTRKQKSANAEKKSEETGSEAKDLQSTLVPGTETWQSGSF